MVNPPVLAWARRQSGHALETVARRLQVKPERLVAWEQGERKPTVRQAQVLAKFYQRPLGVFFLPEPPRVPPLAAEYRRLPGVAAGDESPELRLALRTMLQRREIVLELTEALGDDVPVFNQTAHVATPPAELGARLRTALDIGIEEQLGWRDEWQAWRRWREAVDALGVLVFQFPGVALQQVRGVSLLRFPLPVIGINSKETAPGARIYTLIHELVHLALAWSDEEEPAIEEDRSDSEWQTLERYAEETASYALIPGRALQAQLQNLAIPDDAWDVSQVRRLAAKFRITPLAIATRLRAHGAMSWDGYWRWRQDWAAYVASLRPGKGFATPVDKTLGRGGRPFARLVVEAMDRNRITSVQACRYLDLHFDQVEKLRGKLRLQSGDADTADFGD